MQCNEVVENMTTKGASMDVESDWIAIGELARRAGVAASALRFYEQQGLIAGGVWPNPLDEGAHLGGATFDGRWLDGGSLVGLLGAQVRDRQELGALRVALHGRFDGGALGVISNARYNGRGYDCRLEVHGFDDTVVAGWDQGVPVRNLDPANDFPTGQPHHFFMDRFTEAFRTELAAFVDVVRGGPVQGATVADAVEVAWIAEAATESLRRGAPVQIAEVRR